MFNIDYKKYADTYTSSNNANIEYIVDKLSSVDNLKEYITNIFEKKSSGDMVAFVDGVVFADDAYTNTIYSSLYKEFKRIYQVNEIMDVANKYASLEYFIKFKGLVDITNVDMSFIDDIPENIKKDMVILQGSKKALNQNFALYIFKKY